MIDHMRSVAGGAHPRVSGEDPRDYAQVCRAQGSPPRERGGLQVAQAQALQLGLTPA